jgi:hypothetical protein
MHSIEEKKHSLNYDPFHRHRALWGLAGLPENIPTRRFEEFRFSSDLALFEA